MATSPNRAVSSENMRLNLGGALFSDPHLSLRLTVRGCLKLQAGMAGEGPDEGMGMLADWAFQWQVWVGFMGSAKKIIACASAPDHTP